MKSKKTILWVLAGTIAVIVVVAVARSRANHNATGPAASGPQLLWKFKSDSGAFVSIALGQDGAVYAGGSNRIYALSPDGTLKWKTTLAGLLYLAGGNDGNIYVASSHGLAFGVSSGGNLTWQPSYGLIGFGAPPAIGADGTVIYANTVSDLFAFRPGSSDRDIWSQSTFREGMISANTSLPGQAYVGQSQGRNSPVIWRDETIVLPRQHWLHLFNPDGSPDWFTELTSGDLGAAALADDGTIYVPDNNYSLFAVDRAGHTKWTFQTEGPVLGSAIVGTDGTIFLATSNYVYALAPDGTPKWQTKAPHMCRTSPALAADGTLYVGGDTSIFAVRSDGSVKWTLRTMMATGSPTIAGDGTIYLPCGFMWICAVRDEGSPLAKSPWPKMYHDPANTGRILTAF